MGRFAVGEIVIVSFPFSNLRGHKLRPALVLANAEFENFILCQITSKPYSSRTAIRLISVDFIGNPLSITSYIRPDKLFTADPELIAGRVAQLNKRAMEKILARIQKIFSLR